MARPCLRPIRCAPSLEPWAVQAFPSNSPVWASKHYFPVRVPSTRAAVTPPLTSYATGKSKCRRIQARHTAENPTARGPARSPEVCVMAPCSRSTLPRSPLPIVVLISCGEARGSEHTVPSSPLSTSPQSSHTPHPHRRLPHTRTQGRVVHTTSCTHVAQKASPHTGSHRLRGSRDGEPLEDHGGTQSCVRPFRRGACLSESVMHGI